MSKTHLYLYDDREATLNTKNRKKLGDILVDEGIITKGELQKALIISRESNARLGQVLVELGFVTDEKITEFLSQQFGFPYMKLSNIIIDNDAISSVNRAIAEKHKALPIFKNGNQLTIAIADPLNIFAVDEIEMQTGMEVALVLASAQDIEEGLEKYYGFTKKAEELFKDFTISKDAQSERDAIADHEINEIMKMSSDTPVVKFVNLLLKEAIGSRASDIHLECLDSSLRVRMRIDGILCEKMQPPPEMKKAIISRIKILSNLDIGNSRIFQDGRFQLNINDREIDFRVSVVPGIYGENIVIRILDQKQRYVELEKLGLSKDVSNSLKEVIKNPQGICLLTGPTGSGKTSTLYSLLRLLNSKERKIITIEDPVEYKFDFITQIPVDKTTGIDFSNGLRAVLRHDPDIIMVGEMRDAETAKLALSAAMTGHLVFSTLHTNNAISTIQRVLTLGIDSENLLSALRMILAQRLVRKLCPYCKIDRASDEETKEKTGLEKTYYPVGCEKCNQTGFFGRTAIAEYLKINKDIRLKLSNMKNIDETLELLKKNGFSTLMDDGIRKVSDGVTTLEEVRKAVWEE